MDGESNSDGTEIDPQMKRRLTQISAKFNHPQIAPMDADKGKIQSIRR